MKVKIQPFLDVLVMAEPFRMHGDRGRRHADRMAHRIRPKGSWMNVKRLVAAVMTACLIVLAAGAVGGHSYAQIQPAQRTGQGKAPIAAPSGAGNAASAPLAAPTGGVQATLVGPQSETVATFTPVGLFMRADLVVKAVLLMLVLASFWSWVLIIEK